MRWHRAEPDGRDLTAGGTLPGVAEWVDPAGPAAAEAGEDLYLSDIARVVSEQARREPGGVLIFAEPAAIVDRIGCQGADLIRLAKAKPLQFSCAFNRYFLRITPV